MKRLYFIFGFFLLFLMNLTSCANVETTTITDVTVRVGRHVHDVTNYDELLPLTEQAIPNDSSRSWLFIIALVVGIPLSAVGIITVYIFIREARKRNYTTTP